MSELLTVGTYRLSFDGPAIDFQNPDSGIYSEYIEYYDRETLTLVDKIGTGRRFYYDHDLCRLVEYFAI